MSVIILPSGKAKSCHLKMWSSDVTIPSLILIVYGSGPDLLLMVAFTRTLSPSRNGCADPFHVATSVAMIGLPCCPLCLVKWDPAGLVGDSSAGALLVNHRVVIWGVDLFANKKLLLQQKLQVWCALYLSNLPTFSSCPSNTVWLRWIIYRFWLIDVPNKSAEFFRKHASSA